MKNKFQIQMIFFTAFSVLTSGVFLSGLAQMMGAGDVLVGYISVIMNICGVMIIFFAPFIELFKSRKKVTLFLTVLSKIVTVFIAAIPVFVPDQWMLFVFVPVIVIAFSLQAETQVSLNNWLVHFVEEEKRGRYISVRMTAGLVVTALLSIAAGSFVDGMGRRYIAFVIIFGAAFGLGVLEVLTLLKIDDAEVSRGRKGKYTLKDSFLIPVRDRAFRGFVIYIALFYFLLYLADSFTILYLLKYLQLSYTEITLIQQLFMSLPQVFLLFMWGKLSDKRGHCFALNRCIWFFALEVLFVMLASVETAFVFLPLAYLFAAVANSGFNVSLFNRRYELIPEEGRLIYDHFFSAAVGISLLLGPITGGTIKALAAKSAMARGIRFGEFRILYALSFIGIIILQLLNMRKTEKQPL